MPVVASIMMTVVMASLIVVTLSTRCFIRQRERIEQTDQPGIDEVKIRHHPGGKRLMSIGWTITSGKIRLHSRYFMRIPQGS